METEELARLIRKKLRNYNDNDLGITQLISLIEKELEATKKVNLDLIKEIEGLRQQAEWFKVKDSMPRRSKKVLGKFLCITGGEEIVIIEFYIDKHGQFINYEGKIYNYEYRLVEWKPIYKEE